MNLSPEEKKVGKDNFNEAMGTTRRDFLKGGIAPATFTRDTTTPPGSTPERKCTARRRTSRRERHRLVVVKTARTIAPGSGAINTLAIPFPYARSGRGVLDSLPGTRR